MRWRSRCPLQPSATQADAVADIRAQLDRLLPHGFVTATGARISATSPATSPPSAAASSGCRRASRPTASGCRACTPCRTRTTNCGRHFRHARAAADDVRDIARMIEELRVSLWAQQLGTARPVSEQRIYRAIDAITP